MINFILIGALTSKPYAFTARSWELKSIETIDLFDASCSNIKIDVRNSDIMRVLPVNNEYINEEWISDKTRFAYDGLKRWRFINPVIKKDNYFIQVSWQQAFENIKFWINNNKYKNIILNTGNFVDLETTAALKVWSNNYNNIVINSNTISSDKENYFVNIKNINEIKENTVYIFVGLNLRFENPVMNIKMKKLSNQQNVLIGYFGAKYNNNLEYYHLGLNFLGILNLIKGKHPFLKTINSFLKINNVRKSFNNKVNLILGSELTNKVNFKELFVLLEQYTNKYETFCYNINTLYQHSGKINIKELNLISDNSKLLDKSQKNLYYLIGYEKIKKNNVNDFIIYQGHQNDLNRIEFDVILPSYNWVEKSSLYLNSNRIIQKSNLVVTPPIQSRLDWKIIRMISILFDKDIQFNNIKEIHKILDKFSPNIMNSINKYELNSKFNIRYELNKRNKLVSFLNLNPFKSLNPNFYITNSIERSSKIMNQCFTSLNNKSNNFFK